MSYRVPHGYVPISSKVLRPLGAAYIPILLSEVEQEKRPSGNEDREAIVVGAGLCDDEGERAYTHMPHIMIFPGGQGHFVTSHLGDNMASVTWATKVSTKWVDQIDPLTDIFEEVSIFVVWLGRFAPFAK